MILLGKIHQSNNNKIYFRSNLFVGSVNRRDNAQIKSGKAEFETKRAKQGYVNQARNARV